MPRFGHHFRGNPHSHGHHEAPYNARGGESPPDGLTVMHATGTLPKPKRSTARRGKSTARGSKSKKSKK